MKADYRVKDIIKEEDINVSPKIYSAFITECNVALMKSMILNNIRLKLPSMGSLQINKYKPKLLDANNNLVKRGLKVDFGSTRKLWADTYPGLTMSEILDISNRPLVYYKNKHSDGYLFKFKWDTLTTNLPGKSCYKFRPARAHSRFLAAAAKSENINIDFYEKK